MKKLLVFFVFLFVSLQSYCQYQEYYFQDPHAEHLCMKLTVSGAYITISPSTGGMLYSGTSGLKDYSSSMWKIGGDVNFGFVSPTFYLYKDYSEIIYENRINNKEEHYVRTTKEIYLKHKEMFEKGREALGTGNFNSGSTSSGTSSGSRSSTSSNSSIYTKCTTCNGTGRCSSCNGKGFRGYSSGDDKCYGCNATGRCSICHGRGKL